MLLAGERSPRCVKLKCGRRDTCAMVSSNAPRSVPGPMVDDASDVHVLAVDDSVIDRICIERLLKTSAYKVTAVDSGRKALEILRACEAHGPVTFSLTTNHCSLASDNGIPEQWQAIDEVNLIITDYCMPDMSGYDLLKKVKGTNALKEIPVVIMSSENEPSRISSCLAEGAEEFLVKPVRLADVKRLRGHVRHRQGTVLSTQDAKAVKSKGDSPGSANSKP